MPEGLEEFLSFGESREKFLLFDDAGSIRIGEDELIRVLRINEF
jgi:hypothetical protein